jgi:O-antigen/teichoic acid export membrane protein
VLFLLDLPSELRVRMLERALDWKRRRLLHAVAVVGAGAASIALALTGWGVYALLLPLFIVPLPFIWDLFVAARWRPSWEWSWRAYRPAWKFGMSRIAAASFVQGSQLLESAWLTASVGFATLGVFGRAIGLSQLTCQRIATVVSISVYPVLTKIAPRTDAYRKAGALLLRSVAWSVIPVSALMGLLASEIVTVLYGGRWSAVAPLLPWAVVAGVAAAVMQPAYTLLLAHERQDKCLIADLWRFAGTVLALLIGLPFGLSAYLASLAAVYAVTLGLVIYWLERDGAISVDGLFTALIPPLVATAISVVLAGAGSLLLPMGTASSTRAVVHGVLFCTAYVVALRILYRAALAELVGHLPDRERLSRFLLLPVEA